MDIIIIIIILHRLPGSVVIYCARNDDRRNGYRRVVEVVVVAIFGRSGRAIDFAITKATGIHRRESRINACEHYLRSADPYAVSPKSS